MASITASSLERLKHCPGSVYLPQVRFSGDASLRGTENHEKAEAGIVHANIHALITRLDHVLKEESFVLDTVSRRVTHTGSRRSYGTLSPFHVGVTPDIMGIETSGDKNILYVVDYKSMARVTTAEKNLQIRAQVIAGVSHYTLNVGVHIHKVVAGIAYLNDGELDLYEFGRVSQTATWLELHAICSTVLAMKDEYLEDLLAKLSAGPWCQYCPALLGCPTQKQMLRGLGALDVLKQEDVTKRFEEMSPEEVERAHDSIQMMERILEMAKKARNIRLEREPIETTDGKILKMVPNKGRPATDWPKLNQALRAYGDNIENYQTRHPFKQCMKVNKETLKAAEAATVHTENNK